MPQGQFALQLATNEVTYLAEADGGGIYADVLSQFVGSEHFARKRLGPPKYDDISVQVGATMSNGLRDWIAAAWTPQPPKKDGAILALDFNRKVITEQAFSGALIKEISFRALDAASSATALLTFRFTPQAVVSKHGSGQLLPGPSKLPIWVASSFRLQIPGLDCGRVSRIDSFTVTRSLTVARSAAGGTLVSAGKVEFPNVRITLSASSAAGWTAWHNDFVVQGHNDDAHEKSGTLTFLTPDFKTELAHLELHHLGIIRLTPDTSAGGQVSQQIARVTAELYCEQMELSFG